MIGYQTDLPTATHQQMTDATKLSRSGRPSSLEMAYLELSRNWVTWSHPLASALQRITEILTGSIPVARASIWHIDGDSLVCVDLFDASTGEHSQGAELHRRDYPAYFSALDRGRVIDAVDAAHDGRTNEFMDSYLQPLGIGAMLDATLRMAGRSWGVLCLEHIGGPRVWRDEERRFAVSVADLLAQMLIFDETRHSKEQLAQTAVMQQTILDTATYAIISTDRSGIIRSFNRAAEQMLGYGAAEVIGQQTPLLFHDPTEIAARAAGWGEGSDLPPSTDFQSLAERIQQSGNDQAEWQFVRKDGTSLPVHLSITSILDPDGNISGFLGIAADLSERRRTQQHLRDSEARYQTLFEGAGDAIFLMRRDRFIDCNSATLRMFGCQRGDIIGTTPDRFSPPCQPDSQPSRDKALALISAALTAQDQRFEWQHVRFDGSPFEAEVTLSRVDLGGSPHLLATVRDISVRKRTEGELERSRQELLRRNEILRLLNAFSDRLQKTVGIQQIAQEAISLLQTIAKPPKVALYLHQQETGSLQLTASHGFDEETVRLGTTLPLAGSASGLALAERRLLVIDDLQNDDQSYAPLRQRLLATGIGSALVVPMFAQETPLGTLNLVFQGSHPFGDAELEALNSVANTVALAIANVRHIHDLEHQAHHDPLTGLPNRKLLHSEFQRLQNDNREPPSRLALMLLDLNRFKEVNDTLGHEIGDRLLCRIAPRLGEVLADENALICRLGGDEFAVLQPLHADGPSAESLARRVVRLLEEPIAIGEMLVQIGASIGIALYPDDGADSHALLRCADVAMYEAKRTGSTLLRYDRAMDRHTPERLALMGDFRRALAASELQLHYQPKFDLRHDRVVGFEALLRWQHPRHGLLYPSAFLALVEHSEAIHELTLRVLQMAAAQQQAWREQGHDFPIAVNLSARNLLEERCVRQIEQLTAEGMRLELEITETALVPYGEGVAAVLERLCNLGVRLAIDDFSMGHSSLGYLRLLPVTTLKIDRSFVTDMVRNEQDRLIVAATISLSHDLGLEVVAEGVEDEQTVALLREMHCDQYQGYHLSRPQAGAEVIEWLVRQPGVPAAP